MRAVAKLSTIIATVVVLLMAVGGAPAQTETEAPINPVQSGQAGPVGLYGLSISGVTGDLLVEPSNVDGSYTAFLLAAQASPDCHASGPFEAVCAAIRTQGPQVHRFTIERLAPVIGGGPRYGGTVLLAGVEWTITLSDLRARWAVAFRSTELDAAPAVFAGELLPVTDNVPQMAGTLEGLWQARFGSTRIEALVSPEASDALSVGIAAFHDETQAAPLLSGDYFGVLLIWSRVAAEFYPFLMTGDLIASRQSAFFFGEVFTSLDYTEIGQGAATRLFAMPSGVLVGEFEFPANGNSEGLPLPAEPIVLTRAEGPMTPVPPPGSVAAASEGTEKEPSERGEHTGTVGTPPSMGEGAAALLWAVDPEDLCTALTRLDDALWAGAADGSVALYALRPLFVIAYGAGYGTTTLVTDSFCRDILVRMQASLAVRTP